MNKSIKFIQKNMIWEVLGIMILAIFLGNYYHDFFVSLKMFLPVALFLMLYKPMVYLQVGKAFTKMTEIKKKYLILLTVFYTLGYPISAYLLMNVIQLLPDIDPNLIAGMVLLALSPIASSAPAFVAMSNGKVQLVLVGVIYTFFLSLVVIPLWCQLILGLVVNVPVVELIKSLIIYIIVPLLIGQITRYLIIKRKGTQTLNRLKTPLDVFALSGLFIMVFIIFGINGCIIIEKPQMILYGVMIMNIYFLLRWLVNYITAKLLKFPFEQNVAFTFSASYNMTTSTAIGISTFGPMAAVGTVIGGPFAEMIQFILLVKFFEYTGKKQIKDKQENTRERRQEEN